MACCGKQRRLLQKSATAQPADARLIQPWPPKKSIVLFEYNGNSSLTVHGFVSGKRYWFERPGHVVEVDERDRNLLLAMPSLKQL
ncbi:MAG: hypothetical protein KF749_12055 [Bacteroidetes bacterium]|nr:hypothetical protein [Bacteroidota bacterium]MCW5894238.1 hypothetical protein [Bacteroidota bacterium]